MKEETSGGLMTADGFDAAIIGVGRRCSCPDIVAYDVNKIIAILVERDGMTYGEAEEFYEHNIVGAWVGDQTPIFIFPVEAWMLNYEA